MKNKQITGKRKFKEESSVAREQKIEEISKIDPDDADRLNKLMQRFEEMTKEGRNAYGELVTEDQMNVIFDKILNRELARAHILEAAGEKPVTVKKIAEITGLTASETLSHVTELCRRNILHRVESGHATSPIPEYIFRKEMRKE